jgi:transcriptional regulator with XRE-family HTH domain
MTEPVQSTFPIEISEFERRRTFLGLSLNGVARKAIVSAKTLQRLMAGERAALATIKKLADALGTTCPELIDGPLPTDLQMSVVSTDKISSMGHVLTLVAPIPFELADETTDVPKLLRRLADIIEQQGTVSLVAVRQSSLAIKLLVGLEVDVRSIVAAFCRYQLLELAIAELRIPSNIDLASMVRSFASENQISVKTDLFYGYESIIVKMSPDKMVGFDRTSRSADFWIGTMWGPGDERSQEQLILAKWNTFVSAHLDIDV